MTQAKHHSQAGLQLSINDARHLARELRQAEKNRMAVVSDRQNGYTVIKYDYAIHKDINVVWATKN